MATSPHLIQRLLSVTSAHRLVAVSGQQEIHEAAQLGIVFDDQDAWHMSPGLEM